MNPFTDESRDARIKLGVTGLMDSLRAPESLHRVVMVEKPATVSAGDFALKAMLDAALMSHMVRGDYRAIQRLLVTLFGEEGAVRPEKGTSVPKGDERHIGGQKR